MPPTPAMPKFLACSCAQLLFKEIGKAIADDAEHGAEIPVAGVLFELDPLLERRMRHERCHDEQAARFAPRWAPLWFPLPVLSFLGRRAFWVEYSMRNHQLGFFGNPFEIEARQAEDLFPKSPPVGTSDDMLTPVERST
jgi:hypothetical protein